MSNSGCESSLLEMSREKTAENAFEFEEWVIAVVRARPVSVNGEKEIHRFRSEQGVLN